MKKFHFKSELLMNTFLSALKTNVYNYLISGHKIGFVYDYDNGELKIDLPKVSYQVNYGHNAENDSYTVSITQQNRF